MIEIRSPKDLVNYGNEKEKQFDAVKMKRDIRTTKVIQEYSEL
jgi:hypothetical protein